MRIRDDERYSENLSKLMKILLKFRKSGIDSEEEWEIMRMRENKNEREWERMSENEREWELMWENVREWERMRENENEREWEWERMGMRENENERE